MANQFVAIGDIVLIFATKRKTLIKSIPYRMKIYTEFNLATWLRMVKFMG